MANLCENCVYADKVSANEFICDFWGSVEYARNCGTYKPVDVNVKEYKDDEGD